MLIFWYFSNFDRVPPSPQEISGRQNWANVGNLTHFAQKATKKQQMLKNDVFWQFWRNGNFWNFVLKIALLRKFDLGQEVAQLQNFFDFLKLQKHISLPPKGFLDILITLGAMLGSVLFSKDVATFFFFFFTYKRYMLNDYSDNWRHNMTKIL